MSINHKHLTLGSWLVALIAIASCLLIFESDQLWKIEQKNIFLFSTLFLKEQLVVPGGMLTWVGTWFTQFLYHPWLGVLLLCLWWGLLMFIIKRAFRIPDRWDILMLIPIALLLLTNMAMGYWIYILKLKGHFFVSTIGTTAIAALLWGFRSIPARHYLRPIAIVLTAAIGYPLMGIYALAAALLMGIWSWRLTPHRTEAIVQSAAAILSTVAVPLLCYRLIYYQTNLADIYWAELPLFYTTEAYSNYYITYGLLALFFALLAVTYRDNRQSVKPMKPRTYLLCQAAIGLLLLGSVYHFWMKDENFHHELTMQHRIANHDWQGVLDEAATQKDEPTRAIVMMRNLALSRIGRQGDDMFRYKNGSKAYAAPFGMRLMLVVGPLMYYQYGMLNYCNRLCMELGVELDFRTEDYRLLANCALLDGDKPLARKYLHILKQTLFHRNWAEQTEVLIDHPEQLALDVEREPITHMLHYKNMLGGDDGFTERTLMNQLATNTYTGDPIFQEQTLLATFWTQDINQFWYHFKDYTRLHPQGPMPRYYQEAAYLYGKIEKRQEVENMPFNPTVKETFMRFITAASNYNNQDLEEVRRGLYPLFGDSYYYDFYVMKPLAEY